ALVGKQPLVAARWLDERRETEGEKQEDGRDAERPKPERASVRASDGNWVRQAAEIVPRLPVRSWSGIWQFGFGIWQFGSWEFGSWELRVGSCELGVASWEVGVGS